MTVIKKVVCCWLIIMSLCQPALAFSITDDSMYKIIRETWDVQTIEQLESGVFVIPQAAIDDYVAAALTDYPDIKAAHLFVHSNNKLTLELDTAKTGHMRLEGEITNFTLNKDKAEMQVHIEKKELLDKPFVSWFFSHMSLGMVTKLFGNVIPNQAGITTKIHGNMVDINFKDYVDQSPLKTANFMGTTPVELITVNSLSTDEGQINLHTSFEGPATILALLKKYLASQQS